MGFLPRNSFSISHLSKHSPFSNPHTQVPSPSSSPPPPPLPPKDLMGTDSSGASGSEEEEDEEAAEDLERILLSLCSSSDEEMEAPPSDLGDVGDGWALNDGDGDGGFLELRDLAYGEFEGEGEEDDGDGDGGFLELRDLAYGEFEGEVEGEEEEEELGDGEVVDGDGFLDDFGVLELELMEVGDLLVGLEEVDRRQSAGDGGKLGSF